MTTRTLDPPPDAPATLGEAGELEDREQAGTLDDAGRRSLAYCRAHLAPVGEVLAAQVARVAPVGAAITVGVAQSRRRHAAAQIAPPRCNPRARQRGRSRRRPARRRTSGTRAGPSDDGLAEPDDHSQSVCANHAAHHCGVLRRFKAHPGSLTASRCRRGFRVRLYLTTALRRSRAFIAWSRP